MTLTGRCACGTVRYQVTQAPLIVHCCHCRWCQRESGAAFAMNAWIESRFVQLTSGKVETVPLPSESGYGQIFHRCETCKVAMWSNYLSAGKKFAFVRVGTLDDPDSLPPDIHIYTESKQPWLVLEPDTLQMPQYYRRSQVWSADSLKRREIELDRED